jgi:guanine deaminase
LTGSQFFLPGFIDCHIHASQYPNAGIGRDLPLLDWLQKYTFPLEGSFKDSKKAKKVYTQCVKRTLAQGTTTASYYGTIHVDATNILADICKDIGQRAFIGKVFRASVTLIVGLHESNVPGLLP